MKNVILFILLLLVSISCSNKMQESYRALINNFIIEKQVMLDTIKVELVFF